MKWRGVGRKKEGKQVEEKEGGEVLTKDDDEEEKDSSFNGLFTMLHARV